VSGQNSNRINWLAGLGKTPWESMSQKARKMGIFSKGERLSTCKRMYSEASKASRFRTTATST
jgi:hypothetical protein